MNLEFNRPYLAGYENATVCNEPLFLYVEKKIGTLPEYVKCTASPFAFCVSDQLIEDAKKIIENNRKV